MQSTLLQQVPQETPLAAPHPASPSRFDVLRAKYPDWALEHPARAERTGLPGRASGLVISAISRERSPERTTDIVQLRFPSAQMVESAAGLFTPPTVTKDRKRAYTGTFGVTDRAGVYTDNREGPVTYLDIAPGLVRLRSSDLGRAARADEAATELGIRAGVAAAEARRDLIAEREQFVAVLMACGLNDRVEDFRARYAGLLEPESVAVSTRGVVSAWSSKSRANLVSTICELDIMPLVQGVSLPGMLTLTLPGDWLAVAPDARTAARLLDNFTRAYADRWGVPLAGIWKREFQKRGAPHWHIWMVPPVLPDDMPAFRAWCSAAWTAVLKPSRAVLVDGAPAVLHGPHPKKCACSEWCRSLAAGTGFDQVEGARARDPKRLAVYFLKESLGGEDKAYQNSVPRQWCWGWVDRYGVDGHGKFEGPLPERWTPRAGVGRFWGVRKIEPAVVSVELEPAVKIKVRRLMRRWQAAQGITRQVRAQRIGQTGTVRRRPQRRSAVQGGSAGWIAVTSGAAFASQLARYTDICQAEWAQLEAQRLAVDELGEPVFVRDDPAVEPASVWGSYWGLFHGPYLPSYSGPPAGSVLSPAAVGVPVLDFLAPRSGWAGDTLLNWLASDPDKGTW